MEYSIDIAVNEQSLTVEDILSVNGTVDIIRCNFTFNGWDDFPARQAIFNSRIPSTNYVAAISNDTCLIPWEALQKAGEVKVALVGTNTDGQVQRTETKTVVIQRQTLQGGVNSIDPTPDQYAQFIEEVAEMMEGAGVMSVNGMTGDVTLDIPSKTSQLTNDSGYLTSIPSEYVTESELTTAISGKADTSSLSKVATSGSYTDLSNKPTIPTKTSQLTNDSGYLTSVPVTSVNNKTGAVSLTASDVGALPSSTTYVKTVNGSSGAVTITVPTKTSQLTNDSGFLTSAPVTSVNGRTGAVTGLQDSNLVTSLSASSTDAQYPSAKCVYDLVGNVESLLSSI